MLTAATLYDYLQQKIDKAYSRYMNPTRANRLLRESIFRVLEKKLDKPAEQQFYDELSALIKGERIYTPVTNTATRTFNAVSTSSMIIQSVGNSGGLSPTITIISLLPHNLAPGSQVQVSNITGFTYSAGNINGLWTVVTTANERTFTYVATGANISGGGYTNTLGAFFYNPTGSIIDYDHLLTVRAKFLEAVNKPGTLTPVAITGVSSAAQMVVTAANHNRRKGEKIVISDVTGTAPLTTNINAELTIIAVPTVNTFIVNASGVGGTYTSGGSISSSHYNYCEVLRPDEEIAIFGEASYLYPRVKQFLKSLRFYADKLGERVCSEIEITYVCLPAIEIDVNNVNTDLELYYTAKLLYFLADVAAQNFAGQIRDGSLFKTETMAIIDHP